MKLSKEQLVRTIHELPEYGRIMSLHKFRKFLPMLASEFYNSSNVKKQLGYITLNYLVGYCIHLQTSKLGIKMAEETGNISIEFQNPDNFFEVFPTSGATIQGKRANIFLFESIKRASAFTIYPDAIFLSSYQGIRADALERVLSAPQNHCERMLANNFTHEFHHVLFFSTFGDGSMMLEFFKNMARFSDSFVVIRSMHEFHSFLGQLLVYPKETCYAHIPCFKEHGFPEHIAAYLKIFSLIGISKGVIDQIHLEWAQDEIAFAVERNKVMLESLKRNYGIAPFYSELSLLFKEVMGNTRGVEMIPERASQAIIHVNMIDHILKRIGRPADEFRDDILLAHAETLRMIDTLLKEMEKAKDIVKYLPH